MKINVKILGTEKLRKSVEDKLRSVVNNLDFKKEVGTEIVKDIQRNARSGNTIQNGRSVPMEPLQPNTTVPHRTYLREAGNATARPYRDEFSNLSMSGQLIDSVKFEVIEDGVKIFADGQRDRYVTKSGKPSKARPISNAELASIHQKGDPGNNLPARPFIGLRDEMRLRILTKIREFIRRKFFNHY
jgi:phage gpG-like protein